MSGVYQLIEQIRHAERGCPELDAKIYCLIHNMEFLEMDVTQRHPTDPLSFVFFAKFPKMSVKELRDFPSRVTCWEGNAYTASLTAALDLFENREDVVPSLAKACNESIERKGDRAGIFDVIKVVIITALEKRKFG